MHHLKLYHAMLRKPLNVWNFQFLHSAFQKLSYEVSIYRKHVKPKKTALEEEKLYALPVLQILKDESSGCFCGELSSDRLDSLLFVGGRSFCGRGHAETQRARSCNKPVRLLQGQYRKQSPSIWPCWQLSPIWSLGVHATSAGDILGAAGFPIGPNDPEDVGGTVLCIGQQCCQGAAWQEADQQTEERPGWGCRQDRGQPALMSKAVW